MQNYNKRKQDNYNGENPIFYLIRNNLGLVAVGLVVFGAGILMWNVILSSMFDSQSDSLITFSIIFYYVATTALIILHTIISYFRHRDPNYALILVSHLFSYIYIYVVLACVEGSVNSFFGLFFMGFLLGILPCIIQIVLVWITYKIVEHLYR